MAEDKLYVHDLYQLNALEKVSQCNRRTVKRKMAFNILPFVKTPFTDMFGLMAHHQHFGPCADFELAMMNCMEAYGADRSLTKCKDLIDDFKECHFKTKQIGRENAMRYERHRQLIAGDRTWSKHYEAPPKPDSY